MISNSFHTAVYEYSCKSYVLKPVDFSQFAEARKHLELYWLVLNETPQYQN